MWSCSLVFSVVLVIANKWLFEYEQWCIMIVAKLKDDNIKENYAILTEIKYLTQLSG